MFEDVRLIAFDVDGTLAETDDYYIDKAVGFFSKIIPGASSSMLKKAVRPFILAGETIIHVFYRTLDILGLDSVISRIHNRVSVKNEYNYEPIEGMVETIEKLSPRYLIGIITSGSHVSTEAFIQKFGLEKLVQFSVSAEDCKYIKPHSMPLLKMAEEAGVPIENCLMVGDTIFDIICAKRAGAHSAAVASGFDSRFFLKVHHPEILLDSVKDLPDIPDILFQNEKDN